MMANERHDPSNLYPGFAPAIPNHRTSAPLSRAAFELSFAKIIIMSGAIVENKRCSKL